MHSERRQRSVNAHRQRAFVLLCFGFLLPVACAEGVQDATGDGDGLDPSGGTGDGSAGSSAGKANSGAGQSNGTAGSATGGGGAKGTAGAGSGGSANGGTANGGAANGGASNGGSAGKASAGAGGAKGGAGGTVSTGGGGAGGGGTGGSVAGATSGTAGSSSVAGFSVQYKNLNGSAMDAYISCEILAKNAGPNSLQVSELKVRYYFTDEPKKTNTFQNNFQHINLSGNQADLKVTQTVVGMAPTKPTADTYIEFSFSSSNHATLAPGEALDFAWQMQSADPSKDTFTESNDYSFDASKSALADWTHVVLLQGNSPLWGATP